MSGRLEKEELEEVSNLISKKFIPEIIRVADTYNYDRDSLIKYVSALFFTMAEVATFENYNVSPASNLGNPNNWIPVSERLPEKTGFYLCTVGATWKNPRVMRYEPKERINDAYLWRGDDGSYVYDWFVEAWQPLPEPYKSEEGDGK